VIGAVQTRRYGRPASDPSRERSRSLSLAIHAIALTTDRLTQPVGRDLTFARRVNAAN